MAVIGIVVRIGGMSSSVRDELCRGVLLALLTARQLGELTTIVADI
jgi:hypothetical protein